MKDDKPTGKELDLLKKFSKRIDRLSEIESRLNLSIFSITDAFISLGHALEGVRTNGMERINTIQNVMKRIPPGVRRDYINDLLLEAEKIINKTFKEYEDNFVVCNDCKGEKGEFYKSGGVLNNFRDCDTCEGRGILPRKGN